MAVAYDNTASATGGGGGTSYSASHLLAAAGNSRILVAKFFGVGPSNAATKFSSVLCNGVAPTGQLTPDVEYNRYGNYGSVSVYYWLESSLPANGTPTSYNVTATSATGQWNGHLVTLSATGVAQVAPSVIGRSSAQDATASSVSLTTTVANSLIVDAVAVVSSAVPSVTPTAGQTEVQDVGATATYRFGLAYEAVGAVASYSQTWSWTNTSTFNMSFALALAPATASSVVNVEVANLATGNSGTPVSHTLTAKANRGVLVFIDQESTTQATGVTYNSIPMTRVVFSTSAVGVGNASSIWAILQSQLPVAAGSYSVAVSGLGATAGVAVVEINNVAQVIPSGTAIDTNETGDVSTSTATITAPSGDSLAVGCAGLGNDVTTFNTPPSGTGTWTRLFTMYAPPTSAHFVGAYQKFSSSGAKNYTETSPATWFRESQCLAVFAGFVPQTANAPFFGCTF